ncbi:MAG TPA: hypothetical protein ENK19_07595 [Acidobacteria bacterium]|nr:hypothetical protein [Acidobacteriota bacterium]
MEADDILAIVRAFNEQGVGYVLIGGVAVNVHGIVRATEDVDFLIDPGRENIARIRAALRSLFDDDAIEEITAPEVARYAVIRYGPPSGSFYIDLLGRIGEAFRFGDVESETVEVEGVPVNVATPRALYRMKRGTLREKDRQDAVALRTRFALDVEGEGG